MRQRKKYLNEKVKIQKDQQYEIEKHMAKQRISNSQTILATKHQKLLKKSKDIQQMAADHVGYFKDKRMRIYSGREKSKKFFGSHTIDPNQVTSQRNTFFGPMTKKKFIHVIHPSSKLIIDKRKDIAVDEHGNKFKYPPEINEMEEKHRLRQTDASKLITKPAFIQANSCGPLERRSRFVGFL